MNFTTRILRSPSMLLLAIAATLLLQNARATLYLSEPFDYPVEALTNAAPYEMAGFAPPMTYNEASATMLIVTNDLYYYSTPQLTDPMPVNHCRLQWGINTRGMREINGPIGPAIGTTVYASFIFYKVETNFDSAELPIVGINSLTNAINSASSDGMVFFETGSTAGTNANYPFAYQLGIKIGGGASTPAYPPGTQVYYSGETNSGVFGQTNFIVMEYTYNGGAGLDTVAMWVNPDPNSFGGAAPAPTTNDVAATNCSGLTITPAVGGLQYFQIRGGSGADSGPLQMDDLRIGTTWADVTPTCFPAGIVTPPANQSVSPGQMATFSVVASGASPTYQWQTNSSSGWVNIDGATSSSYTTPATVLGNNGLQFQVIVSVSCDDTIVTSTPPAVLTVQNCVAAGVGATTPASPTINAGDSTNFSVTATGTSPTYQWQTNNGSDWVNIGGATSSTYTTPSEPLANNGLEFQCLVSVACNSTISTSTPAILNVQCNPATVSNPSTQKVIAGQTATYSVTGGGSDPTYQWAVSYDGGNTWTNILNATNATYTTPPTSTTNDGDEFECTVSVACDSTSQTSQAAYLQVTCTMAEFGQGGVGGEPQSTAVAVGQSANFSISSDSSNPTYQWQTNNDGIFVNVNGATNANYATPAVTMGNNNEQFQCVIYEPCDDTFATSSIVALSVEPANGYFQSVASAALNSPPTWQVSYDGGNTWLNPAPLAPSLGDETNVTIENGDTVENSTNVLLTDVVVQNGGEITVDSGETLTITNGSGTVLDISGIVDVTGTVNILTNCPSTVESGGSLKTEQGGSVTASAGSLTFKSGSTLQDNHTTGVDTIPTATWNTGSTLLIAGFTTDTATFTMAEGQTLYNLIWNCTSQTSQLPFGGDLPAAVEGNWVVESTGTGEIRLSNNNSPNWNVGSNLDLLDGQLTLTSGAGKPIINVSNNVYIASGAVLSNSLSSTGGTINFDGIGAQTYTNQGTIIGPVIWVVRNGSVLTASGVISSNLTLASGGSLQASYSQPNLFSVAGNLSGTNGTVIVNLGGNHLGSGTYPLFTYGGIFTGSLVPSIVNGTVTGTAVIDAGVPNMVSLAVLAGSPNISAFSLSGTNLNISGSSGTPGVSYGVLESTNLLLPLSQWTPVIQNGVFNGGGTFNTNVGNSGAAQEFLIIQSPSQ